MMTARDQIRMLLGHVIDDLCVAKEKIEKLEAENADLRAQLEQKKTKKRGPK